MNFREGKTARKCRQLKQMSTPLMCYDLVWCIRRLVVSNCMKTIWPWSTWYWRSAADFHRFQCSKVTHARGPSCSTLWTNSWSNMLTTIWWHVNLQSSWCNVILIKRQLKTNPMCTTLLDAYRIGLNVTIYCRPVPSSEVFFSKLHKFLGYFNPTNMYF